MGSEFKWEPSKHTLVCELQIHVSKHLLGCPVPDAGSKVTGHLPMLSRGFCLPLLNSFPQSPCSTQCYADKVEGSQQRSFLHTQGL